MFNRLLASIGIGSATIDTLLEKTRYAPGEEVNGLVRIRGGNVEQQIETIQLSVMTEYIRESNDQKHRHSGRVGRFHVSHPFVLQPGETREVPFAFRLPYETPLTLGRTPVWIRTELDIKGAVDPSDNDRIEVVPGRQTSAVLEALEILGFRLRQADCEYSPRLGGSVPFVQELEFAPTGQFRGHLDELEAIVAPSEREVQLLLQIDRRARGLGSLFAEALDLDESFVRLRVTNEELAAGPNAIAQRLSDVISRHI